MTQSIEEYAYEGSAKKPCVTKVYAVSGDAQTLQNVVAHSYSDSLDVDTIYNAEDEVVELQKKNYEGGKCMTVENFDVVGGVETCIAKVSNTYSSATGLLESAKKETFNNGVATTEFAESYTASKEYCLKHTVEGLKFEEGVLSWNAPKRTAELTSYVVLVNSVPVLTVDATATQCELPTSLPNGTYEVAIVPTYNNNEASICNSVSAVVENAITAIQTMSVKQSDVKFDGSKFVGSDSIKVYSLDGTEMDNDHITTGIYVVKAGTKVFKLQVK